MRVVTIIEEPFAMKSKLIYDTVTQKCVHGLKCSDTINNEIVCCVGFAIEIFENLITELNIDVMVHIVKDGNYGAIKNGSWNGLVGEIERGEADIAVAPLTITYPRIQVIDFTTPFMEDNLGILLFPEAEKLSLINFKFIEPLSGGLQLSLWIIMGVIILLVYIFENHIYFVNSIKISKHFVKYYGLLESMTYTVGVALQRDIGGKNPSQFGPQILSIVFAFAMVIFITTYTAVLAAQSMQKVEVNPLKGTNDPRVTYYHTNTVLMLTKNRGKARNLLTI